MANAGLDAATCQGIAYTINSATADEYASVLWTMAPSTAGVLTGETNPHPDLYPVAGFTGEEP